jgi:hypothetical protein
MTKTIYTYLISDGNYYKIGKSNNVKDRFKAIRCANPNSVLIGYTDKYTEKELHEKYKEYKYKLEWFNFHNNIIIDVLNDFNVTDKTLSLFYYTKYNVFYDEASGKWLGYNPTGYNLKNYGRFLTHDGKYKLGNYRFASKQNITRFFRGLLNDLTLNKTITDKDIILAVEDLIKYHPDYNKKLKNGYKYLKTKIDTDEWDSSNSSKRYTNFCLVFNDDSEWNFSNQYCINNINKTKPVTKRKNKRTIDKNGKLCFGKHKGKTIHEVLISDIMWLKWAYENVDELKVKLNTDKKYKDIIKVNLSHNDTLI